MGEESGRSIPIRWKLLAGAIGSVVAARTAVAAILDRDARGALGELWTMVDGRRMHARISVLPSPPDVVPVVLVHGFVISSSYMVPTAARLAPECPVYAPDLPGFGLSEDPDAVLDVPGLANALVAWMDAVQLPRASLLANSFGCQVAADVAARHQQRVERLVLVGPTTDAEDRSPRGQFARLVADMTLERSAILLLHQVDYARAGARRIVRTARHALADRIEEKLPRVIAPTLVIRGERDPVVSEAWAEQVTRLIPDARLATIPGAPHALNFSSPDALIHVALPFLLGSEAREAYGISASA